MNTQIEIKAPVYSLKAKDDIAEWWFSSDYDQKDKLQISAKHELEFGHGSTIMLTVLGVREDGSKGEVSFQIDLKEAKYFAGHLVELCRNIQEERQRIGLPEH